MTARSEPDARATALHSFAGIQPRRVGARPPARDSASSLTPSPTRSSPGHLSRGRQGRLSPRGDLRRQVSAIHGPCVRETGESGPVSRRGKRSPATVTRLHGSGAWCASPTPRVLHHPRLLGGSPSAIRATQCAVIRNRGDADDGDVPGRGVRWAREQPESGAPPRTRCMYSRSARSSGAVTHSRPTPVALKRGRGRG